MKPQIPWLRVFVEGVVIVGSILLALAADAWWDERQQLAEEREILYGLRSDFEANRQQLAANIARHQAIQGGLVRLAQLTPTEAAALPADSVFYFSAAIQGTPTFDARDGTLDEVIASGRLATLRDTDLREVLVEWQRQVQDSREQATEFSTASERVVERVATHGGPWGRDARDVPSPAIAEANRSLPPPDLSSVPSDSVLAQLLRVRRYRSVRYFGQLVLLAELADRALSLVETNAN